ncbi:MAG: TlpA disulfide reductase family protein [Planctomycetota bacterium]|nr:TlpA disulfide reductase family protein [Planctomycetota bacterium]
MRKTLFALAFILLATFAFADNPTYLGEKPPSLQVGRFVNSDMPVIGSLDEFLGDVVIVEFFRTSCGPCKAAMPHLAKVWQEHQRPDFHLIATTHDSYDLIKRFLYHESRGVQVNYPVAVENRANWGVTGVPMMYIIGRDGKVAWAGNPHQQFKDALEAELEKPDPNAPDHPDKSDKVYVMLAEENYSSVLRRAEKAKEDEEGAAFGDYIIGRVKTYYDRYIATYENVLQRGDMYTAKQLLKDLRDKFSRTPYEDEIRQKLNDLEDTTDFRKRESAWKYFHKFASEARAANKGKHEKGIEAMHEADREVR